ncbi:uncharacterized protein LOC133319366 [Danaus plexippus]|uniref:uncharacterized protein LOC133319366 n=1 Tax=Danaus plexippus TaxID=13037 RepID=UPI002AB1D275|nr:uncharacterized protein LOC133319366 [Danaus plexippus]
MADLRCVDAPRHATPSQTPVYWWTPEIAQLRSVCVVARRRYTRQRRQHPRNEADESRLRDAYKEAKSELRHAICRSKESAREELLARLDGDPWGRPYLGARNKIRAQTAPVTESLEPDFLRSVVCALFPTEAAHTMPADTSREPAQSEVIPAVSLEELERSLSPLKAKQTAPGPDGVPRTRPGPGPGRVGRVVLGDPQSVFENGSLSIVLERGETRSTPEGRRPADSPSAYRPIVLLDDAGKLFERILATRVVRHISSTGPDLAQSQYGFRGGRSTIDAILKLRSLADDAVSSGRSCVGGVPRHHQRVQLATLRRHRRGPQVPWSAGLHSADHRSYLRGREISFVGGDGRLHRHEVRCGVPQGRSSGLSPVELGVRFRAPRRPPDRLSVVCYADDTLVLARGDDLAEGKARAEAGAALIVRRIQMLGLRVGLEKTEALLFTALEQDLRRTPASTSAASASSSVPG